MRFHILIPFILMTQTIQAQNQSISYMDDNIEAMKIANENNMSILMVFAGSDWCRPCMKFKKEILESEIFNVFASEKMVVLYLDFPSRKKNQLSKDQIEHNEALAEKYNASGTFPKILLMDQNMNKLKDLTYSGQDADEFITQVNAK